MARDVAGASGYAVIAELIGALFNSLLVGWVGEGFIERKRVKDAARGFFSSALRVVSGSQPGLSRFRLMGKLSVRPGQLSMKSVLVPIVEIVAGTRRPGGVNEIVGGDETIIVRVRSETAVLEWSMPRRFEELALSALGVPESGAAPSMG